MGFDNPMNIDAGCPFCEGGKCRMGKSKRVDLFTGETCGIDVCNNELDYGACPTYVGMLIVFDGV
jgi:hypothetical protein